LHLTPQTISGQIGLLEDDLETPLFAKRGRNLELTDAVRSRLERWCEANSLRPRVAGEFDDSALMKAFGQCGAGVFIGPTVLEAEIETQYGVKTLGRTGEIVEEFFAISVERRVTHPCVVAITAAARDRLFVTSDVVRQTARGGRNGRCG